VSRRRWHHWRPRLRRRSRNYVHGYQRTLLGADHLEAPIEEFKRRVELANESEKADLLEKLLVLQAPRAALAQAEMDTHPHGYHNREKRLYELIDFNDTFVAAVLAQPPEKLAGFAERMQLTMAKFCASQKLTMLTDEQYDAIVRGLSREIAVYLGARQEGFSTTMTTRTEDAFGIDMVITDPKSHKYLNIDCKTPSAFRYRLEELEKEGRITTDRLLAADQNDYVTVINNRNEERIPVTILCVRPERLGEMINFRFVSTKPLGDLLRTIFAR
jgi:hypothetical protein